jgi:hypothetical protein
MPTSQYFNNYGSLNEQRVIEDLIVESIKIMGFEAYYLPNDNDQARDLLFGEDPVKKFQSAFQVEVYLSSSLEYGGEREFFSKFGLEIRNTVKVVLSKRTFSQRVPQNNFTRPREGDLVYIPFLNGTGELFEIKFTDQTKDFFMLGRKVPYFYELEMEKFKYSQEIISTGMPDIDDVVTSSAYQITLNVAPEILTMDSTYFSFDITDPTLTVDVNTRTYSKNYQYKEIVYQSPDRTQANATAIGVVQSFIPLLNTLTVSNIAGEFLGSEAIIGASSKAISRLVNYDPLKENLKNESYDNYIIKNQANNIVNLTEINPFGSI